MDGWWRNRWKGWIGGKLNYRSLLPQQFWDLGIIILILYMRKPELRLVNSLAPRVKSRS